MRRLSAIAFVPVLVVAVACGGQVSAAVSQGSGGGGTGGGGTGGGTPATGAGDPTQLPAATGQDESATFTYGRTLKAGESYVDPTTGVTVLKLTDANTPIPNARVTVHTAQVTSVSLPWGTNGAMRTISVMERDTYSHPYLVDVNTQTLAISNWRSVDAAWGGSDAEGAIAFSPTQPQIVYVASGSQIQKYNTATNAFVSDGTFPKTISGLARGSILFVSADENVFVVTQYQRQWFKYWHVDTGSLCQGGTGQGGLTPGGAWGWGETEDANSNMAYKVNTADCSTSSPFTFRTVHPAGVVGNFLAAIDPSTSGGPQTHYWDMQTDQDVDLGTHGGLIGGSSHMAGNWVVGQPSPPWALVSTFTPNGALVNAIGFFRLDGSNPDPRLLAHTDTYPVNDQDFYAQPHAASSPDGRIVVWSSNQHQSPRIDVFMAIVPGAP